MEQFSLEQGSYNSGTGFALEPGNGILNFTITDLAKNTSVEVELTDEYSHVISGNVTTDGSGTATFAIGVWSDTD